MWGHRCARGIRFDWMDTAEGLVRRHEGNRLGPQGGKDGEVCKKKLKDLGERQM